MNAAIWAHPWDIIDEGTEAVADRLLDIGITEVNLATTMHSVQTLNPHNPERKTFFADASAYFQPNESRYGELVPDVNETMGDADWLAEISVGLETTALSLNSWTVPFHSSKQGRRHPQTTLENPFGDSLVWGLCPSNPDVQEYGTTLVTELADRGDVDGIEMELADFQYGTGYGWHHQEFFTHLGDLGELLFGLCFCEHCRANARRADVDIEAARESARKGLEMRFEGQIGSQTDIAGWLAEHPSLARYVDIRKDVVTDLFDDFDEQMGSTPFGYYLKMGGLGDDRMGVEHSWKHGLDLDALSEPLDYVTVLAYHSDPTVVRDDVRTARSLIDVPVNVGLLAGHPIVDSRAALVAQAEAAAEAGAEKLSFYGYGVVPERNLEWIRAAIDAADRI
ncbi:hypothetical protein [Halomontanus rarus]|uniref:hypothetical protein n=1 Tax=Halomontanus rarus TaxID=3034020 RepID=UPI001A984AF3